MEKLGLGVHVQTEGEKVELCVFHYPFVKKPFGGKERKREKILMTLDEKDSREKLSIWDVEIFLFL